MRLNALAGTGPLTATKVLYVDGTQGDGGDVTVSVTDPSGAVVASGSASKSGSGVTTTYTFPIPLAILADPTSLRMTWTRTGAGIIPPVDTLEVSENTLFTEADARGVTTSGSQVFTETGYPDSLIASARLAIGEMFEDRTGRSWYARYCRREISPDRWEASSGMIKLHGPTRRSDGYQVGGPGATRDLIRILTCTVDGTAVDVTDLVADDTHIFWTANSFPAGSTSTPYPVVVEYVYGADPVGWEVRDMALRMLRANIVPSDISSFATSMSSEDGTFRITALPRQVEEWLRFHTPIGVA